MDTILTVAATANSNGNITEAAVLSALGGVLVTGLFGVILALIQRSSLKQQSEAQAQLDRRKWHRELRRQSYADCIVAFEKLRDVLAPLSDVLSGSWPVPQPMAPEAVQQVDGLIDRLHERYDEAFQRCQVVRLEGPATVSAAAQRMLLSMGDFRNSAEERVRAAKATQHPAERRAWDEAAHGMHEALEEFMATASTVIETE